MRKLRTGLFQNGRMVLGPPVTDQDTHRSDERPPSRLSEVVILKFVMFSEERAFDSWANVQVPAWPMHQ